VNSEALAAVLAAVGLGILLVARLPAARRGGALAWVAGTLWLAENLLHSSFHRVGTLVSGHPVEVVPAIAVAVAGLVAAAVVVHRWPWAFAIACVLAAPVLPGAYSGDTLTTRQRIGDDDERHGRTLRAQHLQRGERVELAE